MYVCSCTHWLPEAYKVCNNFIESCWVFILGLLGMELGSGEVLFVLPTCTFCPYHDVEKTVWVVGNPWSHAGYACSLIWQIRSGEGCGS